MSQVIELGEVKEKEITNARLRFEIWKILNSYSPSDKEREDKLTRAKISLRDLLSRLVKLNLPPHHIQKLINDFMEANKSLVAIATNKDPQKHIQYLLGIQDDITKIDPRLKTDASFLSEEELNKLIGCKFSASEGRFEKTLKKAWDYLVAFSPKAEISQNSQSPAPSAPQPKR